MVVVMVVVVSMVAVVAVAVGVLTVFGKGSFIFSIKKTSLPSVRVMFL